MAEVVVRTGTDEDMPALEGVFTLCFPEGWYFGKTMEDGSPIEYLVLTVDGAIVGFAAFCPALHYRGNMAVLEAFRHQYTRFLCNAFLARMREIGGDWWGKCRPGTSYPFWLKQAEAGRVVIVGDEALGIVNGEGMRKVTIRPV